MGLKLITAHIGNFNQPVLQVFWPSLSFNEKKYRMENNQYMLIDIEARAGIKCWQVWESRI